jgi:lipoprotein-anchoring transpeptidase ErfK/SrfK
VERTVLETKVVISDEKINQYLDTIAAKVDRKGSTRKVSSFDGSIIAQGSEGTKLDKEKARETIKDALQTSKTRIALAITTSEIKEEVVQPGFTPGKWPGKYIEVNLKEQNLYQWEGTNLLNTFKVSTGKWSMPTPTGEFSINGKDPRAYSRKYELYMPYWMAFIGSEYGIHELPEWANGVKEGEAHLGTPVSHGCIRLGRGSAQTIYDWAEVGTPVYVHK